MAETPEATANKLHNEIGSNYIEVKVEKPKTNSGFSLALDPSAVRDSFDIVTVRILDKVLSDVIKEEFNVGKEKTDILRECFNTDRKQVLDTLANRLGLEFVVSVYQLDNEKVGVNIRKKWDNKDDNTE